MLKLTVIGKDVSQSLSPRMHTFIIRRLGGDCTYDAVSIPPAERKLPILAAAPFPPAIPSI